MLGSQCELGLATAGCAHTGVAVPNLAYESDVVGPLRYETDIVVESPRIQAGELYPPSGAGLGVKVDLDRVEDLRCG